MCYDVVVPQTRRHALQTASRCVIRPTRCRHVPVFEKNPRTHHQRLVGEDGGRMLEWNLLNLAFLSSISLCRDSFVTSTFFGTSR